MDARPELTDPLLVEMHQRGLLGDCTDLAGLQERLAAGSLRAYVGFDPTADSLHVGSLMPLFIQRMLARHGHEPVLLVGGATGMIGDPSGRSDERNMLDREALDHNRDALRRQMLRLVGDDANPVVVDNRDWIEPMSALELLGEVGRHFPVNTMLARDSVKMRRDSDAGMTFTEFSYQLLQAFDFWWLRTNLDVELQLGGSDQWGNITAGTDFMRRRDGSCGWGLVWPLLTKADGTKFGKTASGNVWLDPDRTSPFAFWQFWRGTEDRDVDTMLLRFCDRPVDEISVLVERHHRRPERAEAQIVLADSVTSWVHGAEASASARAAAEALFGDREELTSTDLDLLEAEIGALRLPWHEIVGSTAVALAQRSGLCSSLGDARRVAADGGLRVGRRAVTPDDVLSDRDVGGGWVLLRRGKRSVALVRAVGR